METKKFCKNCQGRDKSGWCLSGAYFVPKKQTKAGKNPASTCDYFKKK